LNSKEHKNVDFPHYLNKGVVRQCPGESPHKKSRVNRIYR